MLCSSLLTDTIIKGRELFFSAVRVAVVSLTGLVFAFLFNPGILLYISAAT
jgi:hypothetical protein